MVKYSNFRPITGVTAVLGQWLWLRRSERLGQSWVTQAGLAELTGKERLHEVSGESRPCGIEGFFNLELKEHGGQNRA